MSDGKTTHPASSSEIPPSAKKFEAMETALSALVGRVEALERKIAALEARPASVAAPTATDHRRGYWSSRNE